MECHRGHPALFKVWPNWPSCFISHGFPLCWFMYSLCATSIHWVSPICQALCYVLNQPSPFFSTWILPPFKVKEHFPFSYDAPSQMLPGHRDPSWLLCLSLDRSSYSFFTPSTSARFLYPESPMGLYVLVGGDSFSVFLPSPTAQSGCWACVWVIRIPLPHLPWPRHPSLTFL